MYYNVFGPFTLLYIILHITYYAMLQMFSPANLFTFTVDQVPSNVCISKCQVSVTNS